METLPVDNELTGNSKLLLWVRTVAAGMWGVSNKSGLFHRGFLHIGFYISALSLNDFYGVIILFVAIETRCTRFHFHLKSRLC